MDNEQIQVELDDNERLMHDLQRDEFETSLLAFVQAAWHIVEPTQPLVMNWHIEKVCHELQDLELGSSSATRVLFNLPPGTLKTNLISVMFPSWVWARKRSRRFMTASHGLSLPLRDNVSMRNLVTSGWYQSLWPVSLVEDQNTKTRYNTVEGGWRYAVSVGGAGVGEHPDYIIIDDPIKPDEVTGAALKETNDWFDHTIAPRGLTRRVVVIVVMQRLAENDLSGHLLARGNVRHVSFPMRYMKTRPEVQNRPAYTADPRDPRTEEGELLFPALIPEAKVRALELDLGPIGAAGQLQQQPLPEGGAGLFKLSWFKYVDAVPARVRRTRGWDTAATEDGGDWTVGVLLAEELELVGAIERATGRYYVEHVAREQASPAGVNTLMLETAKGDGKHVAIREEREGGSSGKAVINARAILLKGYDYRGVTVGMNKVLRAKPFRAQVEAGNVFVVRGEWNKAYTGELVAFPLGVNDDQVDGSSASFNALMEEPQQMSSAVTWGRRR